MIRFALGVVAVVTALAATAHAQGRGGPGKPGTAGQLDGRSFRLQRIEGAAPPTADELVFAAGKVDLASLHADGVAGAPQPYTAIKNDAGWSFTARLRGDKRESIALAGVVKGKHVEGTLQRGSKSQPAEARFTGELVTLYERLGGEAPIAAIVDDLLARFRANKIISATPQILEARAHGDAKAIRDHFVTFFCRLGGGPQIYEGRSMRDSHAHLHITPAQWQSGLDDLDAVLEQHRLPRRERDELRAAVANTRPDIVAP